MARILIADGDAVERDLLADLLASGGHETVAAADGDEALSLAERERPDAAVLDLLLPRKDGFTVLLHLRSREAMRALPVIFVSSEPAETHGPIAAGLGAAAYLEKPWSGEEVLAALDGALGALP